MWQPHQEASGALGKKNISESDDVRHWFIYLFIQLFIYLFIYLFIIIHVLSLLLLVSYHLQTPFLQKKMSLADK